MMVAEVPLRVTDSIVGAAGRLGREIVAVEISELPTAVTALTVTVTALPGVRFVIEHERDVATAAAQVPFVDVAEYEVIGEPPSRSGVAQVATAEVSEVASMARLRGASATFILWTRAWAVFAGVDAADKVVTVTTFTS